ncbi:MAG: autotransporter domain-containing protein [Proteobacteria bacterium]|nr:autotransporter domain-containing protein [Pseudomonadota bacterium]
MLPKSARFFALFFLYFFYSQAFAVTLTTGQTDYTTTSNITTSSSGIISSLSGSSTSLNKIKNTFIITTGNSGATSSAYGIRSSGSYNQITNDVSGSIITTGSSGRGISVAGNSKVYNLGSIATQGTTSYGIYAGSGNDTISNSGSITTSNTTSYGIYLASDNNSASNSGTINTQVYGIYSDGNSNQINNSGIITTTVGSSAHGIFVSAGSSSTASSSSYNTITNSGTINSNANGIYNKDNYSQIVNSGTIGAASGNSIYGIRNEGENVTITNSGTISATNYAIYNSGSNSVINNSGTLSGGVLIGSATLNILGGTISGTVNGSENTGSVVIGSGVTFNQTANFTDLDNLTINSNAALNSSAAITANNIFIASDSSLNLNNGSSVTGSIKGSSNSTGNLNISNNTLSFANSIGASGNSLANLNIDSDSVITSSNNIFVDEILLSGALNFNGADNLTISGNLTGSGSATFNIADKSQTIDGNFTLNSGDKLAVTLKNQGAGSLAVTGLVSIDSNAKLEITTSSDQGYIANNTSYKILSGSAQISSAATSSFSSSNISLNGSDSNISGLLEFTANKTSDGLTLNINHLAANKVTANKNAQNIYQNLVDIGANSSGKLLEFQEYLDNSSLSSSAITEVINQLAPQSSKASLAVTNNAVNNSIIIAENRLEKNRLHNKNYVLKEGVWGQIFGGSIMQKSVEDDDGYKANSAGIAFGADKEISDTALLGAALSSTKSSTKTLDLSKQNLIDTYQINFYASQNFNKYYLDSVLGLAVNHFSSNRSIKVVESNAVASYLGQTYALKIKSGFVKNLKNGFNVNPEISLNFLRNNIDGYSERGADELNLKVSSVAANFLEARAGINFAYTTKISELPEFKKFTINLKTSYGYSLINDAPTTTARLQGQSTSFNSQISNVDRASLKLGSEVVAHHKDDTNFVLSYNFENKETYQSHFAIFKVRQEF